MAHRNPDQVARLLRVLHDPGNRCVVHVDRKAPPDVHRGIRTAVRDLPGVDILPSTDVRWGGWSMVEVQLRAIRRLLDDGGDWSHFVNLSGQDFPLRPVSAIQDELAAHPDRNHLEYFRPRDMPWTWENPAFGAGHPDFRRPESRVDRVYVELPLGRGIRPLPVVRRRFPAGVTWYGGSQWMTLSRAACRYVTGGPAGRLRRFYRHTFIPDESFFQTALLASPFRSTVVNDNRRLILWEDDIVTLTSEHRALLCSSDAWFARKFDDRVDSAVLDLLEQRLLQGP